MKIKKAILTGGGHATRLRPITSTINKHLIKLAGKPMIYHAIEKIVKVGVTEIFINTNPGDKTLEEVVGDGSRWGVKIKFFEQKGGPKGIADVVNQAKKFIGSDPFIFYLSDNIILGDLNEFVKEFENKQYDCMLALSKVKDPQRFGVPIFEGEKLVDVVEKPKTPPNDFAVTGIYIYASKIFFKAFKKIKLSNRGEYEISDIHSHFLKKGLKVGYKEITGWWKDTGKPEDLILANNLLLDMKKGLGDGHINVKDFENTEIKSPVMIGKNCKIKNCAIGPYVTIGDNCVLENIKISESLVFEDCDIKSENEEFKISKSIIGDAVKLTKKQDDNVANFILGENAQIDF